MEALYQIKKPRSISPTQARSSMPQTGKALASHHQVIQSFVLNILTRGQAAWAPWPGYREPLRQWPLRVTVVAEATKVMKLSSWGAPSPALLCLGSVALRCFAPSKSLILSAAMYCYLILHQETKEDISGGYFCDQNSPFGTATFFRRAFFRRTHFRQLLKPDIFQT